MKRRVLLAGLIPLIFSACNIGQAGLPSTPTTPPTVAPSLTPAPTITPFPTLSKVSARIKSQVVNCRYGPGMVYELINELREGQSARVEGRNETSTWWYVADPGNPGGYCWVANEVVDINGESEKLPVVPPPSVSVKDVSLLVDPPRIVVECSEFPQTFFFEAEITTNGPTLVNWQWEASNGVTSDIGTIVFEEAGPRIINEYYQVNSANDYWVRLHILAPNPVTVEVPFRVTCTP